MLSSNSISLAGLKGNLPIQNVTIALSLSTSVSYLSSSTYNCLRIASKYN